MRPTNLINSGSDAGRSLAARRFGQPTQANGLGAYNAWQAFLSTASGGREVPAAFAQGAVLDILHFCSDMPASVQALGSFGNPELYSGGTLISAAGLTLAIGHFLASRVISGGAIITTTPALDGGVGVYQVDGVEGVRAYQGVVVVPEPAWTVTDGGPEATGQVYMTLLSQAGAVNAPAPTWSLNETGIPSYIQSGCVYVEASRFAAVPSTRIITGTGVEYAVVGVYQARA